MLKFPPVMRPTFLAKRTPEVPRCGTAAPQVLCSFQRTFFWACALVAATARAMVTPATANALATLDLVIKSPPVDPYFGLTGCVCAAGLRFVVE
jgi:hypothetical protein